MPIDDSLAARSYGRLYENGDCERARGNPRAGISELGLSYVAGILPTTTVWRPGEAPLPPAPRGRGRPGQRLRRDETHRPVSAKTLALELATDAWQQITWRDGSNTPLTSRFAPWRVRPAHDDRRRFPPQDLPAPGDARNLHFPTVVDPEDLPLRSQRHVPNSIATLRIRLARTLVPVLPRCPCCGRPQLNAVKQNK
jgi:SRSO17 transposase